MYGFKVFVSTLILILIVVMLYACIVTKGQSGKTVAYLIIIINALSLAAIWG